METAVNTERREQKAGRHKERRAGGREVGREGGMKIEGDINRENREAVMTEAGKICSER